MRDALGIRRDRDGRTTCFDGTGRVATHGEIWTARSDEPLAEGEEIEVLEVDGLTLRVRRAGPATGRMPS